MAKFELFNHPTFESAFLLEDRALASGSATSRALELGQTLGGIRVVGVFGDDVAAASGDTVAVSVQLGDDPAGTAWETVYSATATAGTAGFADAEFASYIPYTEKKYVRATVTPTPTGAGGIATGGSFSVYLDYLPR